MVDMNLKTLESSFQKHEYVSKYFDHLELFYSNTNCKNFNPLDLDLTLIMACKLVKVMSLIRHEDYLE